MKKYMTIIGFGLLIMLSMFITDKTTSIMLNNDKLMMTIKEASPKYYVSAIDGITKNNTFIPGISGIEVDIKKSYNSMKKYGIFLPSLLEYNEVKPRNKLKNNYDKYIISGNESKKMVSLIMLVHEEDDLDSIINILDNKNAKSNFFVDGYWFEKNNYIISKLIEKDYVVGNLSYNGNYNDGAYIWMDTIIKRIGKQKDGYCYLEKENSEALKICAMNKNYTIIPSLILKNNYLSNIKKNLKNGMIISLDVNNSLINELPAIINYVESKGYEINNLDTLLKETIK